MKITYSQIREAQGNKPYTMSLVGEDAKAVQDAVNRGIDSHLEACFLDGLDSYKWRQDKLPPSKQFPKGAVIAIRLDCEVSPQSLPTLIRRLLESGDHSESLATDMLLVLGFEDTDCAEVVPDYEHEVVE